MVPTLDENKRILLVSDMHMGDGAETEPFTNNDDAFRRFLDHVRRTAEIFIILGDGFDLAQAFSFDRVYRSHRRTLDDLNALSAEIPTFYLEGNHEGSLDALKGFFPFTFVSAVDIGKRIRVEHGNRLDPRNHPGDVGAFWGARALTVIERIIRSPVRIPMRKHYYWSTRLGHWLFYRYGWYRLLKSKVYRAMGREDEARHCLTFLDYWGGGEWGDIHGLLAAAEQFLSETEFDTLVCGHSHEAGVIRFPGGTYINTGSWTFGDATYAEYEEGEFIVRDFRTGRAIGDEAYRGILGPHRGKSFFDWWARFYLGWFRYDVPAMNRETFEPLTGEDRPGR